MESILNCCSSLFDSLPNGPLSFVPASLLGILSSFTILLLMYHKHYQNTLWESFVLMMKNIFHYFPNEEHSEFMKCNNESCVRCRKAEKFKVDLIKSWKEISIPYKDDSFPRIAAAIRKLIEINGEKNKVINGNKTSLRFDMELPSNDDWTNLDVLNIEKELLKMNFNMIKEEFREIMDAFKKGDIKGWKNNNIPEGHWCIFPIIDQGEVNEENCVRCPYTAALLGSFPSLMKDCVFGNVCFSMLYPDSHIEPHCGPTNIRLRCHLGIEIPEGCWLEVNGSQQKWKEGEVIVFDDSFLHSAYFEDVESYDVPRVVMLLDFWHPSITPEEKSLLLKLLKWN